MPRTHNSYPPDFRAEAVRLVLSGVAVSRVSDDLGVNDQTIRNWVRQHKVDHGKAEGPISRGDAYSPTGPSLKPRSTNLGFRLKALVLAGPISSTESRTPDRSLRGRLKQKVIGRM
jgi:transposase-like protein